MRRAENIKSWEIRYAAILHAIRANSFEVRDFYLKPKPRLDEDVNDNGKPAVEDRTQAAMKSILRSLAAAEASGNHQEETGGAGNTSSLSTICQPISRRNSLPLPDTDSMHHMKEGTLGTKTYERPTSLDFHPQSCNEQPKKTILQWTPHNVNPEIIQFGFKVGLHT